MVRLNNLELQQFLEEEVSTGRFASVEAAVEAAVMLLKGGAMDGSLDEETLDAIDAAEALHERGESRPWNDVRAELIAELKLGEI